MTTGLGELVRHNPIREDVLNAEGGCIRSVDRHSDIHAIVEKLSLDNSRVLAALFDRESRPLGWCQPVSVKEAAKHKANGIS